MVLPGLYCPTEQDGNNENACSQAKVIYFTLYYIALLYIILYDILFYCSVILDYNFSTRLKMTCSQWDYQWITYYPPAPLIKPHQK